jgi:predicted alpha/beta-hydrolase family hydrolase
VSRAVPGGVDGTWEVATGSGPARVHLHAAPHGRPRATLVLGHGAGGGVDARDLVAVAAALPAEGIEVALVEQPWRVAGRRVASSPATLDAAWRTVLVDLRSRGMGRRRLVVGGRSAGARVACRTVADVAPDALLLLAFPVRPLRQPVGRPAPSRLPELVAAARAVPTVVVQGERDRMGAPDELALGLGDAEVTARVVPVAGADHSFRVPANGHLSQAEALELVVRAARATALRLISGRY